MGFFDVTAQGNLTKDAVLSYTKSGKAITKLSIAINTSKDKVDYINIDCWDKVAEWAAQYRKGQGVVVRGRMTSNNWEDKNGTKHLDWRIVAQNVIPTARINNPQTSAGDDDDGMETIELEQDS